MQPLFYENDLNLVSITTLDKAVGTDGV